MFLTRAPVAEASGDRSAYGNWWFEPVGMRTTGGMNVTSAKAMGVPAVWSCINVLAKSLAMMPFCLYRQKPNGRGREKVLKHWLYRLLAKAPNRFQSPFEWRQMIMGHLALRGNAFNQIVPNGRGEIVELLPLHPDRMQMEFLPSGDYRYLYTDQNGKKHTYLPSEVWHLRGLSSDGYVGLSPIEVARESIGESLAMQSYASRFYANDARPGGWIEFDGKFSSDGAKHTFRESWQKLQGGANARKVAVLERGMKYHELKLNNADSQFVEARSRKPAELASIWGVPPHKIGDLSKSTNNNIEHQSIEFWTDTMLPWAEAWESSISFFLLGEEGEDLEPQFDMSRLIRADSKSRGERIRSLVLAGVMAPNEGREEEGLDPLEGLDRPLRPLNMVQVNEDGSIDAPEGGASSPTGRGPDGGAVPGKAEATDPRLRALAGAAADRIARKEVEMVAKAGGDRSRMVAAYDKHASFVASALSVDDDDAAMYCAGQVALLDERPGIDAESMGDIARTRLERLALGGKPDPVNVGANAMLRLAGAISAMPAPVVNNSIDVAPAAVTVQPAEVHAHVDVAAPAVTVAAPTVHNQIDVAAPQVDVHVPATHVDVHVPPAAEQPTPVVHNHVNVEPAPLHVQQPSQGGQADRPWPTQTVIKQRDAQGRADVIETRPLDN